MNNQENAIIVKNLSKSFRLPHEKISGVKQGVIKLFSGERGFEEQKVLKNISFEIKKGEFFGIVGRNGSGKSTLLKILAGIYAPDSGDIAVLGSLTPFIELGVGFNPELSGRENVFLNGALLGFSRKEMTNMYNEIVEFAELEKFMDQKLKNYSSGMQVRLAFSIAIQAKSDILLIDEVLAVGDSAFQQKCFDYFQTLKKGGRTVVLVSHDRNSLERFCDRGVLIDNGEITSFGSIKQVLREYSEVVLGQISNSPQEEVKQGPSISKNYVEIKKTQVLNHDKVPQRKFNYGEKIFVEVSLKARKDIHNPIAGITVWEKHTQRALLATNTLIEENKSLSSLKKGDEITISLELPNNFNDGEFIIEPAIANESATVFYDQVPNANSFIISGSNNPHSLLSSENKLKIEIIR
ncbi:ABC transporter ATP-binding protein [Candidatus Berkelbacteria bacterium]|nr:ABC transporter ATP-binding protein [Candidatus Berkelbacteria bacterium]